MCVFVYACVYFQIWDDELATVAAKWARQCIVGHDTYRGVPCQYAHANLIQMMKSYFSQPDKSIGCVRRSRIISAFQVSTP